MFEKWLKKTSQEGQIQDTTSGPAPSQEISDQDRTQTPIKTPTDPHAVRDYKDLSPEEREKLKQIAINIQKKMREN